MSLCAKLLFAIENAFVATTSLASSKSVSMFTDLQVYRFTALDRGLQDYRSTGLQVYKSTGLHVYRRLGLQVSGLQDYRFTGFRFTGLQAPVSAG